MSEAPKDRKDDSPSKDWTLERVFRASDVLPTVADTLFAHVRGIEEAIKDSDVVLDANVLLLPFGAGASSLKQIVDVYARLIKEKQLFVPAQVVREFIKNRPTKIAELYQGLSDKISKFIALPLHYSLR